MTTSRTPYRFLADRMLGRLARYLRLLGYDVSYPAPCADAELVAMAMGEGRVLLTRDLGFMERLGPARGNPKVVVLRSPVVTEQVAQLASEGWLGRPGPPRCACCNRALEDIDLHEARHLVPPYTFSVHTRFLYCGGCNRIYWEGSHLERFRHRLLFHRISDRPSGEGGTGSLPR